MYTYISIGIKNGHGVYNNNNNNNNNNITRVHSDHPVHE
jgi:hypothetical protein